MKHNSNMQSQLKSIILFLSFSFAFFGMSLQATSIFMEVNDTDVQPGEEFRYIITLNYDRSNRLLSNAEVNYHTGRNNLC